MANPDVTRQAKNNTSTTSASSSNPYTFLKTVIGRIDHNEAIYIRIMDDPEFTKPSWTFTPDKCIESPGRHEAARAIAIRFCKSPAMSE